MITFNGLPSKWILTNFSNKHNSVGKSVKSLLVKSKVFNSFKYPISFPIFSSLFYLRSKTDNFGAFYIPDKILILLQATITVSNF